ncbi:MAG: hypothetical protein M1840_003226 [Geoglossum simile]|nr:MAG: hypothetical protein M1840_003226 [Geoglossum simile]
MQRVSDAALCSREPAAATQQQPQPLLPSLVMEPLPDRQRVVQAPQVLTEEADRVFNLPIVQGAGEIHARLDQTNQRLDQTNQRLDQTNQRLDQMNQHHGQMNQLLGQLAGQLTLIRAE